MPQVAPCLPAPTLSTKLRSAAYAVCCGVFTVVFGLLMPLGRGLPFRYRYALAQAWVRLNLWLLRLICRLSFHVEGLEHLPQQASIVLCKHQSEWETLALQVLFPPLVFVLKKEILRWPFFGWGMATLDPIAIDRSHKRNALRHVLSEGEERLRRGLWVVLFPEGTRVQPGARGAYNASGALLAERTGRLIVPVAHNAAELWGQKTYLKRPGVIQVRIGAPIDPRGRKANDINRQVEQWIEDRMSTITDPVYRTTSQVSRPSTDCDDCNRTAQSRPKP